MTIPLVSLLAVMLITEPEATPDAGRAAAISADADRVYERSAKDGPDVIKSARIRAERSDFDRKAGVAMFEKNVLVEYADDYDLHADRLFVFMTGSNVLSRIVALGHVAITNDSRVGSCAMATYLKQAGEIEMYGGEDGTLARLTDVSDGGNAVEGAKIRFWLDSEQVEIENSGIKVRQGKEKRAL